MESSQPVVTRPRLVERTPTGPWAPSADAPKEGSGHEGVKRACVLANWIEANLWIVTKDRKLVRIRLNAIQAVLLSFLAWCWAGGWAAMVLVPKARQGGVTTFWQAVFFALCVIHDKNGETFRCATIAHVEEQAGKIFAMARRFEKKLGRAWKADLDSRQQGQIVWSSGSAIFVQSAQVGDAAGKGDTIHALHGTEVANWADRAGKTADELWTSVMPAVAKGPDAIVVLESTAKGRDPFFHSMVHDATNPEKSSPFSVVFLPWYLSPEYSKTWESYRAPRVAKGIALPERFVPTDDEEDLRSRVRSLQPRRGEEWIVHPWELTDEQLIWRREAIETDCKGDLATFRRYYPSTLEECFLASESCMFGGAVLDSLAASWKHPAFVGDVESKEGKVTFRAMERGPLSVWKHPLKHASYVIGADVADGVDLGDYQVAYVVDKDTLEVVAVWHGKVDPDDYAVQLELLGLYYGRALVAVENNYNPSVATTLRKRGYPNLYYYRDPEVRKARTSRPGWNTNRRSRRLMLAAFSGLHREGRVKSWCKGFLEEATTFVWNDKEGSWRAAHGRHDDRVMAQAIAVYLTGQRPDDQRKVSVGSDVTEPEQSPALPAWERERLWLKKLERTQRRYEGGSLYL